MLDVVAALDILFGNTRAQSVVYLNRPNQVGVWGNFASASACITTTQVRCFGSSEHNFFGVAAGDINADGALDIVAADFVLQSAVYLNDGQGNFFAGFPNCGTSARLRCLSGQLNSTNAVELGDLNGDGALDIVTARNGKQSGVYLNDAVGAFSSPTPLCRIEQYFTWSVAVGDVDNRGGLDLVVGVADGQSAILSQPNGQGNFDSTNPLSCIAPANLRCFGGPNYIYFSVALGRCQQRRCARYPGRKQYYLRQRRGRNVYSSISATRRRTIWHFYHAGRVDCAAPPTSVRRFWPRATECGAWRWG